MRWEEEKEKEEDHQIIDEDNKSETKSDKKNLTISLKVIMNDNEKF